VAAEGYGLPADTIDERGARPDPPGVGTRDGRGLHVAVIGSRFNAEVTDRLVRGALEGLAACGVDPGHVVLRWVPGAFEMPLAAQRFAASGSVDAVVCLGAVIRGETGHYEMVAGQCAAGIQRVQLDTGVPVAFGVLTTENREQALQRSMPDESNKGREAAMTAVEMVHFLRRSVS